MITVDQGMARSRGFAEGVIEARLKHLETELLVAGVDVDDIDAVVAENRALHEQHLSAQLDQIRTELLAWLAEGTGGGG